jgi:hypothetical protein
MDRLDFKEASETVKAVDEELEALLRVVWGQTARERQRDLCFYLAKYPYKHFVLKNGRPLDPDGQPLRADLLVANLLPVGLILDNVLEVIDEVIRREEVIEFPQSLLFKRQLIGLWELIDQQLHVEGRPLSNWTVSSGSRSLRFLEFPTQQVQWDRLRARYRQLSTYDKEAVRRLKEIDLIEMIGEVDRKSKQWATQILYFSAPWFEELERQLADAECRAPAMELASYFNNTSWASLARVRYNDDQLTDALDRARRRLRRDENVFKIILRVRNAAMKQKVTVPGLDNLPELFSRLSFRVKSGRLRQKGRHGSILTFKINWSSHDSGGFQREIIPIEQFYAPFFSGDDLPTSDSRFFRVAVKLDLREPLDTTVVRTPHADGIVPRTIPS